MQIRSGADSGTAATLPGRATWLPVRCSCAAIASSTIAARSAVSICGSTRPLQMLRISAIASSRLDRMAAISLRRAPIGRVAVDQRFAVHPEGRERDELGRTVMQVGADAPEIALVDGRSAARRLLHALPQRPVLGKQRRQLGDASGQCLALALDGAAAAEHDAGQQRHRRGGNCRHDQPALQAGCLQFALISLAFS